MKCKTPKQRIARFKKQKMTPNGMPAKTFTTLDPIDTKANPLFGNRSNKEMIKDALKAMKGVGLAVSESWTKTEKLRANETALQVFAEKHNIDVDKIATEEDYKYVIKTIGEVKKELADILSHGKELKGSMDATEVGLYAIYNVYITKMMMLQPYLERFIGVPKIDFGGISELMNLMSGSADVDTTKLMKEITDLTKDENTSEPDEVESDDDGEDTTDEFCDEEGFDDPSEDRNDSDGGC